MSKGAARVQRRVKAGARARKGRRCLSCNRHMKVAAKPVCQFHKKYEE